MEVTNTNKENLNFQNMDKDLQAYIQKLQQETETLRNEINYLKTNVTSTPSKHIYIINGSGGVGKDTFVRMCSDEVRKITGKEDSVQNYSSVDKIKEIAKMIGWTGTKFEKDRKFLSDLKLLCTAYNDMPFREIVKRITLFLGSDSDILFVHIREPEEIAKVIKRFPALKIKTILVKREQAGQITSNMADANVQNYEYDYVIDNNGTRGALKRKAKEFIERIYK